MYSLPERKRARPPPISIVGYEKTTVDGGGGPGVTVGIGAGAGGTGRYADQSRLTVANGLEVPGGGATAGLSTSRPASPLMFHERTPSARVRRD